MHIVVDGKSGREERRQMERTIAKALKSAREQEKRRRAESLHRPADKDFAPIATISTEHVALQFPAVLVPVEIDDVEVDLILAAADIDIPFRPNLVLTSQSSATSPVEASMAALFAASFPPSQA